MCGLRRTSVQRDIAAKNLCWAVARVVVAERTDPGEHATEHPDTFARASRILVIAAAYGQC